MFSNSGIRLYHVQDLFHAASERERMPVLPLHPVAWSDSRPNYNAYVSEQYRITRASHTLLLAGTISLGNNLDRLITLP